MFCCRQINFWLKSCPERSGEAKTDVRFFLKKTNVLKKGCSNILRPSKLANFNFFIYSWYKILYFAYKNCVCGQKLANVPPGQNVGKRTPHQIWGLRYTHYIYFIVTYRQSQIQWTIKQFMYIYLFSAGARGRTDHAWKYLFIYPWKY